MCVSRFPLPEVPPSSFLGIMACFVSNSGGRQDGERVTKGMTAAQAAGGARGRRGGAPGAPLSQTGVRASLLLGKDIL